MTAPDVCLEDDDLLPELDGGSASESARVHLATCQDCRRRMERLRGELANLRAAAKARSPREASTDHWTAKQDAPTLQELPTVFGKYRVVGLLGKGGQAVVYRVVDPSLGRDLVVKVAAGRVEESTARQRLSAEGRILAQLDHPNVARVVDLSVDGDRPYLVMEYVRGQTLRQYSAGRRLAYRESALLLAQVADALAAAHALGIVHQDVKPANIVIEPDGCPKLLDFGLARLAQVWPADSIEVSGGTLQYLAPEQARGRAEAVGPPCDVFGAGAVLYELLVGKPPYSGRNTLELMEAASQCRFDRDALAACGAPRKLVAVCLKAMSADPQDRYADAGHLARALRQAVRPIRWRLAFGALAALLIAATAWIAVVHWKVPPVPPENVQYLLQVHPDAKAVLWINQQLPIQPGVPFRIQCQVPKPMQAGLFWYDTKGRLTEIETQRRTSSSDVSTDLLIGPEDLAIDHESGMNVVFVCASLHEKPTCQQVEPILHEVLAGASVPRLPPANLMTITGTHVALEPAKERRRGFVRRASPDEAFALEGRFEVLARRLRQRYDFLVGVAFCQSP